MLGRPIDVKLSEMSIRFRPLNFIEYVNAIMKDCSFLLVTPRVIENEYPEKRILMKEQQSSISKFYPLIYIQV